MRVAGLFYSAIALSVAGCAAAPPPDPPTWIRTDGQKIGSNAALEQQFQIDHTVCEGQMAQSASNMQPVYTNGSLGSAIGASIVQGQRQDTLLVVAKGCMAQKGYVSVPASRSEAQREELAKTAKLRAKSG